MKSCDECTECCLKCMHRGETGCNIYEDRPLFCQVYQCLWLSEEGLNEISELRPDKCGAILIPAADDTVLAQIQNKNALKNLQLKQYLVELNKLIPTKIVHLEFIPVSTIGE